MESESDSLVVEKFKGFLDSLKCSNWTLPASEKTIDNLFSCVLELEEILVQEEKTEQLNDLLGKSYPNLNFNKPVDFLMESIIKNQLIDENLTLYAINKYTSIYSWEKLHDLVKRMVSESELRERLFNIIEENPDVDLDLYGLNAFLCDIMNGPDIQTKVQNALKSESSIFLKSIKHAEFLTSHTLTSEMITCLESQTDLKLWFLLMKEENMEAVLDLCTTYNSFLSAVLKFFDKFAEEMESHYDEELNVQYSHVNLDFEEFVKIFQIFLNNQSINRVISEFLESKDLTKKNFLFWVDVKSCL